MLRTSLYLTKEALYAVVGQMRGNRLEICDCQVYPLPKNSLVRGEIREAAAVKEAVMSARKLADPCRKADLLLENELVALRTMTVPRMKKKQLTEFVRMELSRFRGFGEDSLFAYSIVEKQKSSLRILAGAMKRQIAEGYMDAFAQWGIPVSSMAPALDGLSGLMGFLPEMREQNVLAMLKEDQEHVTLAAFKAGVYQDSNQIYCEGGVNTAQNRKLLMGQITAFQYLGEIERGENGLDRVVLCGGWKEEEPIWTELKERFDTRVCFLEDNGCVAVKESVKNRYSLCEFCCATGNLLRRR